MACLSCRGRKLRCNLQKPTCATCAKTGRICEYDTQPKKRGPKKRNLKALEERLEYLERGIRLENAGSNRTSPSHGDSSAQGVQLNSALTSSLEPSAQSHTQSEIDFSSNNIIDDAFLSNAAQGQDFSTASLSMEQMPTTSFLPPDFDIFAFDFNNADFGGLPPLADMPSPHLNEMLLKVYFEYVHPFGPIIHRKRFAEGEPPMCLKYAVWATAALWSTEFRDQADGFYRRARMCLEEDELTGYSETYLSLAHCQSWVLLTWFDSMNHSVVRGTMCSRRATALVQMFGLDRIDADDSGRRKILAATDDWTEKEERRRTFWAAFCNDRWASAGHGWSTAIDERQIATNLPASERAFQEGSEEQTATFNEAYTQGFNENTSYFAAQSIMNLVIGQNMLHLHRVHSISGEAKLQEEAVREQHRHMDKTLSMLLVTLPEHLQLIENLRDPLAVHLNMTLNGSLISLHLATMARLDQAMDARMRKRSIHFLCIAAEEVVSCLRVTAHIGISKLHPFAGFAMFMAAHAYLRVEEGPFSEERNRDSLELILAVANKLYERYNMLWPLFARLCQDIAQSKYSKIVDGRYREAITRLSEVEMKNNVYLAQRMKEHPMPGLLPRIITDEDAVEASRAPKSSSE